MPTANAKNPLFKAGFFIVSFNQYWAKVLLSCQVHLKKRHDVHQTNPDWHSQVATKSLIFLDSAVFILLHEQHHFFYQRYQQHRFQSSNLACVVVFVGIGMAHRLSHRVAGVAFSQKIGAVFGENRHELNVLWIHINSELKQSQSKKFFDKFSLYKKSAHRRIFY